MDAIDNFFGHANQILGQKWLGDEIFDAIHHWTKLLLDISAAGHEQERYVARGFASAKLFEKLAAIEAGHLVIAKDDVGWLVNHFQQSVGTVVGDNHFTEWLQGFGDKVPHQRIVVRKKEFYGLA
jgi:hypothetical protein